ncbi:phenylalanine--tRNA ligase subunit beta [Marinicella sp. S1101]|uniref:phenylalanine--tRNA ligase subunit beta n=1 Tax=Marinicella marina TaxID=2996016 RepID=UPI00226103B8|nr:phenylalanine--tRNA ligase subunit beta [Marinicella marina]MCX7555154.1 phenylalanine--tRNA ligase subunit beta [Marinicella marina]MDJ1141405.1 phenylalanine--tRNA ligase subunit beta [Marinicella marina]
MKFSENWLKQWVNYNQSTTEVMEQLTMLGLEVDGVEPAAGDFSGVVVAEIMACEKHPDADKLKVCEVNAGNETLQIVCGAPNARVGLKTALSKIGAVLPGNFKIKKSKLRGVESQGMLCSEVELGISQESDGIIELPADAPVGEDVISYMDLNDQVIDIDLTPNRADCFCIRGVAREVATLNHLPVKTPGAVTIEPSCDDKVEVTLKAPAQCPIYASRVIKGIDNTQTTPLWMKECLRRSGIKSIHPVVDVTNYVMLEMGQPMHAFDAAEIDGSIIVRMAHKDEEIQLLDQSTAQLSEEFLVIADENKALAVAGVIGGLGSGVNDQTQDIVLESAYFDPATIMGKSRKLAVHTESGLRFERGVDWALQTAAMERATELITQICGGEVAPINMVRSEQDVPQQQTITLSVDHLNKVLGFVVETEKVTQIFNDLGFACTFDNTVWTVQSPSWRFDLAISEDLIEEVVRVVGYDQMPSHRLSSTDAIRVIPEQMKQLRAIKQQLADMSYQEVINYSFVGEKQLSDLDLQQDVFGLANPLNKEMAVMRTHLLPGVLGNIKANLARQEQQLALFELGKVFSKSAEIQQDDVLLMAKTGQQSPEQWSADDAKVDFFTLKGDVETLLSDSIDELSFEVSDHSYLHPGRQAAIKSAGRIIGYLGQVHPSVCQKMKIKQEVYVAELNVSDIQKIKLPAWQVVSKFPQVRRDLAVIIKDDVTWAAVAAAVRASLRADESLLYKLCLFDVYKGDNIEKGYKSLAMALIFQENNRTLEDKEVDKLVSKAVSFLAEQLNAEIRS